jgi:hypothetical protein
MWTFFGADGGLKRLMTRQSLLLTISACRLLLTPSEQEEWTTYLAQHVLSPPPEKVYPFKHRKASLEEVNEMICNNIPVITSWELMTQ